MCLPKADNKPRVKLLGYSSHARSPSRTRVTPPHPRFARSSGTASAAIGGERRLLHGNSKSSGEGRLPQFVQPLAVRLLANDRIDRRSASHSARVTSCLPGEYYLSDPNSLPGDRICGIASLTERAGSKLPVASSRG